MPLSISPQLKLRPPRFAPRLERSFQEDYFRGSRRSLLITSTVLTCIFASLAWREIALLDRPAENVARYIGPMVCLFIFGAAITSRTAMVRAWQAILAFASALAMSASLIALAADLRLGHGTTKPAIAGSTIFTVYFFMFALSVALFRFQFVHAAFLYVVTLISGVYCVAERLPTDRLATLAFIQTALLVVFTLLVAAFFQESLTRRAFLEHHLLQWERNDEVRRRERTEGMLNVLGRAIGVIVHDLGAPLTSVQGGAQAMKMLVESSETDKATLAGLASLIENSAQLLNYLRLSLIEQARVIEGKPTPLELAPASLKTVIEAGIRFQKPGLSARRQIEVDSPSGEVRVDSMKMITVFMNIIGNALKYSDGRVRIAARRESDRAIVAVLDEGTAGTGITQKQATDLFVPFGRLSIHSQIDGTGLGLVSVQKVVEAHGGEIFIEGYEDGTTGSNRFSTARGKEAPILEPPFRTAFVLTLPQ